MVEHLTVGPSVECSWGRPAMPCDTARSKINQVVVGSSPALGAIFSLDNLHKMVYTPQTIEYGSVA